VKYYQLTFAAILFLSVLASCGGGHDAGSFSGRAPGIARSPGGSPPSGPYDPSPQQWVIRPYTDPVTGETYDIVDGVVIIQLKVGVDSPKMQAFVNETGITVIGGLPEFQTIDAVLPKGITVEYAVQNWPSMYADVVASVSPDSAGQTGQ